MRCLISTSVLVFLVSSSAYAADIKDFSNFDGKLIEKSIQEYLDTSAPNALGVSSFLNHEANFESIQKADNANGAGKLLFAWDFSAAENAKPAAKEWTEVADNANGAGKLLVASGYYSNSQTAEVAAAVRKRMADNANGAGTLLVPVDALNAMTSFDLETHPFTITKGIGDAYGINP